MLGSLCRAPAAAWISWRASPSRRVPLLPPDAPQSTPILKINLSHLIWIPLASYCEMTIWEELCMTTVDLGRNGSMNLKL
jgi:hypothetical protein